MRINTNVSAINAGRNLEMTQNAVNMSMSKLSSGFRITRAADDAAGLGIANKMRSDIAALGQASNNAQQANSLLQIAEGATNSISSMLERLKVLATEAGSDTVDSAGRQRIQEEYVQISAEIDRTVKSTKFQGSTLLDGTFANFVDGGTPGAGLSVPDVNGNVTVSGAHSLVLNAQVGYTDTPGAAGKNTLAGIQISGTTAATYTITETQSGGAGTVYNRMTITDTSGNTQTVAFGAGGAQQINFSQFGVTMNTSATFTNTSAGGTFYAAGQNTLVVGGTNKGQFLVGSSGSYGTSGNDYIAFKNLNISSSALVVNALDLTTVNGAASALQNIDAAIGTVNSTLGSIGAAQNRIESATSNLKTSIQNLSAAQSVIRDVDMASEMTTFTKNNILVQAGTAMLAQANQSSQSILTLLRG